MAERAEPLRARFAHWVVGLLAPWLELAPYDEEAADALYKREQEAVDEAASHAYDEGMERGYRDGWVDAEREYGAW